MGGGRPDRRWLYQQAVYDAIEKNVLPAGVTADPPVMWKPGMDIAEAQEETLVLALKDEGCRQTATVKLEAGVAGSFDVEEQLKIESGEPVGGPADVVKKRPWNGTAPEAKAWFLDFADAMAQRCWIAPQCMLDSLSETR